MPAQAPEVGQCLAPQNLPSKTFGELAVPAFDQLPGYQKEMIRWSPVLLGGLKSVGKEGLEESIKAINRQGYGTKFGQKSVSLTCQDGGPFAGKTIFEVAELIRSGKASIDQLPIEYIIRNGKRVTLNNRSLATLKLLEQQPTKLIDRTGIQKFEEILKNHLRGINPGDSIIIRGIKNYIESLIE